MTKRSLKERLPLVGIDHPRTVTGLFALACVVLGTLAALPSLWPQSFPMLHPAAIDTDPENMLREDEPVRVFHNRMKRELSLHDLVVVGVVEFDAPRDTSARRLRGPV